MRYVLLIYSDEASKATMTPAENEANMGAYYAFTQKVSDDGVMKGGEAFQPATAATTVHVQNGQKVTAGGPFEATKLQLGGFYILDCDTLEEATEYAAQIPDAVGGSIEVRPILEFE